MNGNSFGQIFRVTTWGESHGPSLGAIVDGCPAGLRLSAADFEPDMALRQGGGAAYTTPRKENDTVHIESGVFEGISTGTPLCLRLVNENQKSEDYDPFKGIFRPGHADLTTHLKHGHRDHRGGGRSSARETAARVAAGVVAKKILSHLGVELAAWISQAGPHALPEESSIQKIREKRLPLPAFLESELQALREKGDSWGGTVSCRVENLPPGLGEPVFDKLGALLAHACMSLPASVGFEIGGISSALPGSQIRDPIGVVNGKIQPLSNNHGGVLGGMSTGLPLLLAVKFHAPTSVPKPIGTVSAKGEEKEIVVGGRHDAFPLPRAIPMLEAMVAITLVDCLLRAGRIGERL